MNAPTPVRFESKTSRRDVLRIAAGKAGALGVVGAVGGAAYVLTRSEGGGRGDAGLVKADAVDVDLTPLQPGQQIMVFWRTWPVFVMRRTPQALVTLQSPALIDQLSDPQSRQLQQPPYADNWA